MHDPGLPFNWVPAGQSVQAFGPGPEQAAQLVSQAENNID